ncbi:hypothetical protein POM88_040868 [Heracleum sosnowskyi]|uniref:Uncharacterized protein n=1 Tax=Heracleum sosnowskyi TaxID=360622 RepID=A0AAD8HFQ3_9APIA|nr:hypothetical protein POM88_040868 [Heracleum sosnowskyi]
MNSLQKGAFRESNSGPLAPKARIIPLDQTPTCFRKRTRKDIYQNVYSLVIKELKMHLTDSVVFSKETNDLVILQALLCDISITFSCDPDWSSTLVVLSVDGIILLQEERPSDEAISAILGNKGPLKLDNRF